MSGSYNQGNGSITEQSRVDYNVKSAKVAVIEGDWKILLNVLMDVRYLRSIGRSDIVLVFSDLKKTCFIYP